MILQQYLTYISSSCVTHGYSTEFGIDVFKLPNRIRATVQVDIKLNWQCVTFSLCRSLSLDTVRGIFSIWKLLIDARITFSNQEGRMCHDATCLQPENMFALGAGRRSLSWCANTDSLLALASSLTNQARSSSTHTAPQSPVFYELGDRWSRVLPRWQRQPVPPTSSSILALQKIYWWRHGSSERRVYSRLVHGYLGADDSWPFMLTALYSTFQIGRHPFSSIMEDDHRKALQLEHRDPLSKRSTRVRTFCWMVSLRWLVSCCATSLSVTRDTVGIVLTGP